MPERNAVGPRAPYEFFKPGDIVRVRLAQTQEATFDGIVKVPIRWRSWHKTTGVIGVRVACHADDPRRLFVHHAKGISDGYDEVFLPASAESTRPTEGDGGRR